MTRPRKATVDYFPHVVTHGRTMFVLEGRFGNDGYAFWFKLLELLGSTEGHFLDCNDPATWEFLMTKTRLCEGSCSGILDLLALLGAIDADLWRERRLIWCQKFVDGLACVYDKRQATAPERPRSRVSGSGNGGQVEFPPRKPSVDGEADNGNPQSIVEDSKGEESSTTSAPPTSPPPTPEPLLTDATPTERQILAILKAIDGYPFTYALDLEKVVRGFAVDYPATDILAEVKKWAVHVIDKPLKPKGNPRLRFRNWLAKAVEIAEERREGGRRNGTSASGTPRQVGDGCVRRGPPQRSRLDRLNDGIIRPDGSVEEGVDIPEPT